MHCPRQREPAPPASTPLQDSLQPPRPVPEKLWPDSEHGPSPAADCWDISDCNSRTHRVRYAPSNLGERAGSLQHQRSRCSRRHALRSRCHTFALTDAAALDGRRARQSIRKGRGRQGAVGHQIVVVRRRRFFDLSADLLHPPVLCRCTRRWSTHGLAAISNQLRWAKA